MGKSTFMRVSVVLTALRSSRDKEVMIAKSVFLLPKTDILTRFAKEAT